MDSDSTSYTQILAILHDALAEAGGNRAEVWRRLGEPNRTTLYKALNGVAPVLPRPEILCRWLDALDVVIVPRTALGIPGCVAVRMADIADLVLPPADRPDSGVTACRIEDLDGRPADDFVVVTTRDGMPPTVLWGDRILVDTGEKARTDVRDGGMYIVLINNGAVIRRLQRTSTGWLLVSDTPEIVPISMPDGELTILGYVVGHLQLYP